MRKYVKRLLSLLLAVVMVSSLITVPAQAASKQYPQAGDKITDPVVDKKTGRVNKGSFTEGRTRKGKSIWVLKEFVDQDEVGNDKIADAINTARKYGVAEGYLDGTFRRYSNSTRGFTETFINRFFHESGVEGTKIGNATLGHITSSRGTSSDSSTLTRLEAILMAGEECSEHSRGVSMDDFSDELGKWKVPRATPNGGSSVDIYPHVFGSSSYKKSSCEELGYFTASDKRAFSGEYARAANILMFAGVLEGWEGSGLNPDIIINRGQMVKLLITLAKAVDRGFSVPKEVTVSANLSITADSTSINYKDWDNGQKPSITASYNGRGSEGDSIEVSWESYRKGELDARPNQLSGSETLTYSVTDFGLNPGESAKNLVGNRLEDLISGVLVAQTGRDTKRAQDSAKGTITVTNKKPSAALSVRSMVPNQQFPEVYFYTNKPIKIADSSFDPENALTEINYAVKWNGSTVAVIKNFETVDNPNDEWLKLDINKANKTITMETKQTGKYTFEAVAVDECLAWDNASKTIVVTGNPAPPTAIINALGFSFLNRPASVKDASTDPNNDIVKWEWSNVQVQKVAEDGTITWETPNSGSYSKRGMQNYAGVRKSNSVDGDLTFTQKGIYKFDLTVTDATGFTDSTTHQIKAIEDIPVPTPEIGPTPPVKPPDPNPPVDPDPDPGNPDPKPNPDQSGGYPHWEGDTLIVKQNRLFYIDIKNSLDPPASPIKWNETEWNVTPVGGYNTDDLRLGKDSTIKKHNYLSKEVGEFIITITLHNDYSDKQMITNPTNPDLAARTATVKVKIVPDENPLVAIQLQNAQPDFHKNPSSINVKVVATASSPDYDYINYYDWTLSRDNNNDGIYSKDEELKKFPKSKKSEIDLPVPFQSGNTSLFQAKVKVTERFGQPTIESEITDSDFRTAETQTVFEVNWIPCIQYTMREFAYTDDVLEISPVLKDENVETCTVDWVLWKKNGDNWDKVNPATLTVWNMGLHGGQIQIPVDGYYKLSARITDAEGHYEDFTSTVIRIYHLPVAVISDNAQYRWDGKIFNFKESRKFTLDGNASYADDSTGPALHPIDRSRDYWQIVPLDGQDSGNIYVMNDLGTGRLNSHDSSVFYVGPNKFDEQMAILEPGRYLVRYQVTNSFGKKSPMEEQIITIQEDLPPQISGVIEPVVKRGPEAMGSDVTLSIGNLVIESKDGDKIGSYKVEFVYDSNNNGSFKDEKWETLTEGNGYTIVKEWTGYVCLDVKLFRQDVGKYRFRVTAQEVFGQSTLPIVPDTVAKSAEKIFDTEIDNVNPNGTFSVRSVAKGDIVFAIGASTVSKNIQNATHSYANRFGDEASLSVMDMMVETVETSNIDMTKAFNWKTDVSSSIGSIRITNNGQSVVMSGNPSNQGKNAIWIPSTENGSQKFTFNYNIDYGDNFNAAGMLFNLVERGGVLDAYALSFNNSGAFSGGGGSIWHLRHQIGDNDSPGYELLTKIRDVPFDQSGTLTVEITKTDVKISGGGLDSPVSVPMPYQGTGFGFFSNHYSHGCSNIGHFQLDGIALEITKQKSLADAISDVSWREGAEKFVIYVDDMNRNEMDPAGGAEYAKLLSRLMKENIHLITLGSSTNRAQQSALLRQLSQESAFYLNIPHTTALDNSEAFIKAIMLRAGKDTMYVLLNETINYKKLYSDYNGDPQWLWDNVTISDHDWAQMYWKYLKANGEEASFDYYTGSVPASQQSKFEAFKQKMKTFWSDPSVMAQRFKYYHNQNYFDNPLGEADFRSTNSRENWMPKEVRTFDKTGLYKIDYRIKDNPVPNKKDNTPDNPFDNYRYWSKNYANDQVNINGLITNPYAELYVHRRPLAEYSFSVQKNNQIVNRITIRNRAYDLDHEWSRADKGLNLFEWKWKFASDDGWRGSGLFTNAKTAEDWINSQLVDLNYMGQSNILIQYRVRDIDGYPGVETIRETVRSGSGWTTQSKQYAMNQGVWSDYNTVWVTNSPQAPIAHFKPNNTIYNVGDKIEIKDNSYSPNGDQIVKWEFTVTRTVNKQEIKRVFTYTGSVSSVEAAVGRDLTAFIDGQLLSKKPEENKYHITLIVTDNKVIPLKSDPYTVTITIQPTNNPPIITPPDKDNNPDKPGGEDGGGKSLWGKNNPTVYEYDSYDANENNPYYTYGGAAQKRGTEYLDWTLVLDDPDNHDKYGSANDTIYYKVQFKTDRSAVDSRKNFGAVAQSKTYPTKTLTAAQALINTNIAPFITAKNENLLWGAYRITTNVTDIPENGSEGKIFTMITKATEKPLHLYVIPKLDLTNLNYIFNGILNNPEKISPGEDIIVNATTNDRSTGARLIYTDGDGKVLTQEMTLASDNRNGTYTWTTNMTIPGNLEQEDLGPGDTYKVTIQTYTTYGTRDGEETRQKDGTITLNILPLKLFDFHITGVNDPSVRFASYPKYVKDLAFDETDNIDPATDTGSTMKLGYAFNFTLYSKGLKNNNDSIRIRPTFWGYNMATGQYDLPLDMYYRNDNREYVLATGNPDTPAESGDTFQIYLKGESGTLLGSLRELILPKDVRTIEGGTQKWSARYGVPGSAVFVTKGQPLAEQNIERDVGNHGVLIKFDIEAMKGGSPKYNYVGKGQWHLERVNPATGAFINPTKAGKYADGSIIVIDPKHNSRDNYESRPVWTK